MINIGKLISEVPELLAIVAGFSNVEKNPTPDNIESEAVNVANAINDMTGNIVTSDHVQQLGDAIKNVFNDIKSGKPTA